MKYPFKAGDVVRYKDDKEFSFKYSTMTVTFCGKLRDGTKSRIRGQYHSLDEIIVEYTDGGWDLVDSVRLVTKLDKILI